MTDDPTKPDLTCLLFEANDAWRAVDQHRTGAGPQPHPAESAERFAEAVRRLDELGAAAFPESAWAQKGRR